MPPRSGRIDRPERRNSPVQGTEMAAQGQSHPPSKQPIERRETAQMGKFYNGNGHCIYSYQIKMSKTLDISSLT